jgi:hypothetical protein
MPHRPFADTLRAAMLRPLAGAPRRPAQVRVSDDRLAAELRAAFGDDVTITVGPSPELDAVLADMGEGLAAKDDDEGYLADGRVSPARVADMFDAAAMLWTAAPSRARRRPPDTCRRAAARRARGVPAT